MLKFQHVELTVSCDGVGDVYEYIRYPAKFKDFDSKFELLKQHNNMQVSLCVIDLQSPPI